MSKYTFDYFCEEHTRFHDLIGRRSTTQQMALKALSGLMYVAMYTDARTDKERETIKAGLACAKVNLDYRLPYFRWEPQDV